MGQPVTLLATNSPRPGVLRFELNRTLTGMGHERYLVDDEILGDRPGDELARRIFAVGGVERIHMYGSMVTVQMSEREDHGIADVIRALHTYYVPGVEIPSDEELIAMVE